MKVNKISSTICWIIFVVLGATLIANELFWTAYAFIFLGATLIGLYWILGDRAKQ